MIKKLFSQWIPYTIKNGNSSPILLYFLRYLHTNRFRNDITGRLEALITLLFLPGYFSPLKSLNLFSFKMKTVVIIENEVVELKALVNLFEKWQWKINVMTATEEKAAINIMSKQQVDLVVCDLAVPVGNNLKNFAKLTSTFPYVPCIALSTENGAKREEAIRHGAAHCLEKPVDTTLLLQHAEDLLETGTSGMIKGIPIHSFLQMLENEEKTCTLQMNLKNDTGLLYIKDGQLIGAETKNFEGEDAALIILGWQEAVIRIRFFNKQRKRQINKPLIAIITEAARLKNERDKHLAQLPINKKHQLPLQHLPTMGKRIPLEIGFRMKLEFPHLAPLFGATLVGMSPDNYLIVTNPLPLEDLKQMEGDRQRILIKYTHKGRVLMFKSQLLKTISPPYKLLFIEYPGVLHFHELRQTKRSSIFIPCTFRLPGGEELYGVLIDLNITGCLFQIKHKEGTNLPQIKMNTRIMLHCLLPGVKEEQKVNGTIRNLKINSSETKVGIEFENLSNHLADTIGQYLYSIEAIHT